MSKFFVWCPDQEDHDSALSIDTFDHEQAACKWAERSDSNSGEYLIANGHDTTVLVRKISDAEPQSFTVSGELISAYHAWAVDPRPEGGQTS